MLPDVSVSPGAAESTSHLIVLEGRLAQTRLPLTQPIILLGSDPSCDIWLPYPEVAPRHAILAQTPTGWHIRVIDVSKTIAVNGKTTGFSAVCMGDRIGIGQQILELEVASNRRRSEPDAFTSLRLHAAAVAALHASAIEDRWTLDQNRRTMIRRTRQIARRLKLREINEVPVEETQAKSAAPASLALLKDREDLLALERARLDRLRKRLLKRWNTQFGAARTALARREEEVQRRENMLLSKANALETRNNQRSLTPAAAPDSPSLKHRHLTLHSDLLADLDGLRQRNERIRNSLPRDWPVPEQTRHQANVYGHESGPVNDNDDVMRLVEAAEALAGFQARWDAEMASNLVSLEDQAIRMAQREHLIAEREALLETLLEQRVRQSDELNRTIHGAARDQSLSGLQREATEIEIKRLQRELASLNDIWNEHVASPVPHGDESPPAETLTSIQMHLQSLIELLEKSGEWACEAPTASERAELEFLRFNIALYENESMLSHDQAAMGLRQLVQSTCEQIQNGPLAHLQELAGQSSNTTPNIDRRLVMEAKRWKIRAETLEEALAETKRLLGQATGNAIPTTNFPPLRAAA